MELSLSVIFRRNPPHILEVVKLSLCVRAGILVQGLKFYCMMYLPPGPHTQSLRVVVAVVIFELLRSCI